MYCKYLFKEVVRNAESCNKKVHRQINDKTEVHEFVTGFKDKKFLSDDEREARAIIYANDHRNAYERANNEVRLELNRCEICGNMVCEDCTVYGQNLNGGVCCKKCAEDKVN